MHRKTGKPEGAKSNQALLVEWNILLDDDKISASPRKMAIKIYWIKSGLVLHKIYEIIRSKRKEAVKVTNSTLLFGA